MTKIRNIYPTSHYEKYIQANFTNEHCGIDLQILGERDYKKILPVDLNKRELLDRENLKSELLKITEFVQNTYAKLDTKPLWYKINVIDQAINEYTGIGFLNRDFDWLNFTVDYLSNDRAEQSGDTIMTIFDLDFNWAICFTLSQDDNCLKIERFKK